MPVSADAKNALGILENIQSKVQNSEDPKLYGQIGNDLKTMISLFESPIFQGILNVNDSLNLLKEQLMKHPSLLPEDFDINENGDLVLNVPAVSNVSEQYSDPFQVSASNYHMQQTLKLEDSRLKDVSRSVSGILLGSQPQQQDYSSTFDDPLESHASLNNPITTDSYEAEIEAAIEKEAVGRDVQKIRLFKPEGSSLGFSVVGLKSEHRGELGIFVQDLQPEGIASKDGRLNEGDQILAIDGQPLDANISHFQAIGILQKARGHIELVVARGNLLETIKSSSTSSVAKTASEPEKTPEPEMVLNTEWSQVEVIDLVNDGSGLGFGIIGGRSTGVVVKTIVPGGVADKDGRLQSGDHILQIGEVNLRGMGSEQVAAVLRQSGKHVRMVVARPVEPNSPEFLALGNQAPVVPTRILGDPEELERQLSMSTYPLETQPNGFGGASFFPANNVNGFEDSFIYDPAVQNGIHISADVPDSLPLVRISSRSSVDEEIASSVPSVVVPSTLLSPPFLQQPDPLPEMETLDVEIAKDLHGLGITIAGYVCEKEELSGIFVKSINEGSAADVCGKIRVNDQIVEVDGISLQGYNNHQAVEVLRNTGQSVKLKLARYLRGPKFEQLQQAIANCDIQSCPPPSVFSGELAVSESICQQDNILLEARNEFVSVEKTQPFVTVETKELFQPEEPESLPNIVIDDDYVNPLKPEVEIVIRNKWSKVMGPEYDIVIAQLSKSPQGGGLGISLEGTVDVEDGKEVRPHHYIRSILPRGPVGICGKLMSGDELLEVNGTKLLGLNHVEVVSILKELPRDVRLVCCRRNDDVQPVRFFNTRPEHVLSSQPGLGGSLQNLSSPSERLVKAKSDGSLASSSTTVTSDSSFNKIKSRSLEPLTGLAMWSSEPQMIELTKGERGLGFSILDYQDPINSNETVIVIRSLVPGGVAQQDGRLIPGDRLMSVNDVNLENASLDTAVQALKGAPKGIVRIGVAKPLPLPDSASHSQEHISVSDSPVRRSGYLSAVTAACQPEGRVNLEEDLPPPVPTSEPPDSEEEDRSSDEDVVQDQSLVQPPKERLLPSYHHVTTMTSPSDLMDNGEFPDLTGRLKTWETPIPTLPKALERAAIIKKLDEQLGMQVEVVDNGVNGVVVRSISKTSCVQKDGRIQVGDFVLTINNESLRKVSNAQARAILRRAQLAGSEVSVTYIPGGDAAVHRESVLIQSKEELSRAIRNFPRLTTPRVFPKFYRSPYLNRGDQVKKVFDKQVDREFQTTDYRDHPELQRSSTAPSFISKELKSAYSSQFSLTGPQSDTDSVNIEFVVKHGYSDTFATLVAPKRPIDFESEPNLSSEIDIHTSKRASASSSVNELFSDISFDSIDVVNGEDLPVVRDVTFLPTSLRSEPLEDPPLAFHRLPSLPEIPSSSSTTPDKDVQTKSAPDLAVEVKTSPPPIAPKPVILKSSGPELQSAPVVASTSSTSYTSTTAISLTVPTPTAQTASTLGSDSDTPSITTITQGTKSSSVMVRSSNTPVLTASHWGPEKEVEVSRDPSRGLGISIVGGKVDLFQGSTNQGNAISGIFIKNVLADSPAGRNGMLKTGDRIMEVDGVDLRNASHEKAVEVIRGAGNPVRFKIQSLMQWSKDGNNEFSSSPDGSASPSQIRNKFETHQVTAPAVSPVITRKTPSPLVIQGGIPNNDLAPPKSPVSPGSPAKSPLLDIEESDSSDDEDSREGQGKTRSKAGFEIDRSSAGNVRRSKAEAQEDPEQDDDFGYTMNKIKKKYLNLNGELLVVELDRGPAGLGLSLAGNKDRMKMSTFIVGLHPSGYAFKDGRVQVGDEILEVNGVVLHNRCHLNSSAIIKSIPGATIKFILLRRENAVQELAVKPITQFPVRLDDESPEERYAKYKGLRVLTLKKGNQGLGIMIIEGKHAEAGQGIFISDIQEGSLAEQSGLQVGDMILAVNTEELVGADYDTATGILRRTEGIIRLVVSSPSKVKEDAVTPSKDRAKTPEVTKETEKPRIPPKPVLSSLKSSSSAKNVSLPVNLNPQPLIGSKSTPSLNTQSSTILQIKAPSSTPGSLCKTKSIYSEEPPADPTTCPIVPGTETTIEITKEKMGLGLSIVGGKDTLLGSIIIHEVYPDGAAAKDQRLKPGDQILQVNNENFRDATHAKALAALRQTPAKVKMVVFREEGLTKEEDLYDVFDVELFKKPGKGLGLSIVGRKNGPGVFVTEIVKGSVAEADNRLMQGDQILCVNGNDLKTASQEEAAAILKTTVGKTSLKIGRLKGGSRRPNSSDNPKSAGPEGSPSPPYRTVVLERGADGLGFTIVGGSGSPHGDLPIYVKTVFEKGAAAEHGGLERGDQIVAVDSRSLEGVTHQEAVSILKNVKTTVTLTVL